MDNGRYSVYVHIYQNGKLFVLPSNRRKGFEGNLLLLKRYLREVQEKDGIFLYSVEDSGYVQNRRVGRLLAIINNFDVNSQVVDAHPAVYGYNKSFAPYLSETIEVAEIDVEGLTEHLDEIRRSLKDCASDSEEYEGLKNACLNIKERLLNAREYLKRINSLYVEICLEGK